MSQTSRAESGRTHAAERHCGRARQAHRFSSCVTLISGSLWMTGSFCFVMVVGPGQPVVTNLTQRTRLCQQRRRPAARFETRGRSENVGCGWLATNIVCSCRARRLESSAAVQSARLGPRAGLEPGTLRLTGGKSVDSRPLRAYAGRCQIARSSLGENPAISAFALCRLLPPLAALWCTKGQEKGNMLNHDFLPSATLDIHDLEAGGFRDGELTIIGRRKHRTHHHSRGCYVQQIQAPSEKFGGVRS